MNLRDRIKDFRRVPANTLRPDPRNWRTHPKEQQDALRGLLAEVGIADACLARELDDGTLMLVDGHLRTDVYGEHDVPVLVLDLNEEEAAKVLATLDPLAAMADADQDKLDDLLESIETSNGALQGLLDELTGQPEVQNEESGEKQLDEELTFRVMVHCESEQQQSELVAELEGRGLKCQLLMF